MTFSTQLGPFTRCRVVELLICFALVVACVVLAVFVAPARAYGVCLALFIAVYALRLWRLLPSEQPVHAHTAPTAERVPHPLPSNADAFRASMMAATPYANGWSAPMTSEAQQQLHDSRHRPRSRSAASHIAAYYANTSLQAGYPGDGMAEPMHTRAPHEMVQRAAWQALAMPVPPLSPLSPHSPVVGYMNPESLVSDWHERYSPVLGYGQTQSSAYAHYPSHHSTESRWSDNSAQRQSGQAPSTFTSMTQSSQRLSGHYPWRPVGMAAAASPWSRSLSLLGAATTLDVMTEDGGMSQSRCSAVPATPPPVLSFTDLPMSPSHALHTSQRSVVVEMPAVVRV